MKPAIVTLRADADAAAADLSMLMQLMEMYLGPAPRSSGTAASAMSSTYPEFYIGAGTSLLHIYRVSRFRDLPSLCGEIPPRGSTPYQREHYPWCLNCRKRLRDRIYEVHLDG